MRTVRARPERRDPLGDINPYAPSQVGEAPMAFDEVGVGVWRDGEQIVMHEHAPLPAFCLRCGKPASHSKPRVLYWPLTSQWRLKFQVPMCERCAFLRALGRRIVAPAGKIALILSLVAIPLADELAWLPPRRLMLILGGGLGLFFAACVFCESFEGGLRFVRRQGPWLWFRGTWLKYSTHFLDRLPDWPNVK